MDNWLATVINTDLNTPTLLNTKSCMRGFIFEIDELSKMMEVWYLLKRCIYVELLIVLCVMICAVIGDCAVHMCANPSKQS